jgi:hypothetical protein
MHTQWKYLFTVAIVFSLTALAQEPNLPTEPSPDGWRKMGHAPPPAQLTLPAGSWVTIRVNEPLSSDHNQQGDAFTATLAQPLVAEGHVIAQRGQIVAGRVTEVQKGGRVKGTSRLGLELTELSLADGRQIPIQTRFVERRGDTSVGRDVAAVGTATGAGAAIGAVADGGFGAGMGAIAGAAASTIGVLVTRGNQTVVYPETLLTFRMEAPLTISTERAGAAFVPATRRLTNRAMNVLCSAGLPHPRLRHTMAATIPRFITARASYSSRGRATTAEGTGAGSLLARGMAAVAGDLHSTGGILAIGAAILVIAWRGTAAGGMGAFLLFV